MCVSVHVNTYLPTPDYVFVLVPVFLEHQRSAVAKLKVNSSA